jgi:SAM-dependent methyltransferase
MDPAIAAAYDKHYQRPVDLAEDAAIDRILGALYGAAVVDLGCGTAPLLARHSPRRYVGVDLSLAMRATAKARHERLRAPFEMRSHSWRVYHGDACEHPSLWVKSPREPEGYRYLLDSFDVAVSLFAFSYFEHPRAAMINVRELLAPGGRAVVMAYTERYARRKHRLDSDPLTAYTPTSLSMVAADAGLIPTRVIPLGWLPDPVANLLPPRLGARLQVGRRWTPAPYSLLLEARKPYAMAQPVTTR